MEVSLIPFLVKAVPRAAAALVASSLVVSCATSTETPQAAAASGRNPSVAADVNLERVVLQAYRAIGDRRLPAHRLLAEFRIEAFALFELMQTELRHEVTAHAMRLGVRT